MGGGSIRKLASVFALVGCVIVGITLFPQPGVSAEPLESSLDALGDRYATEVRPLVAQFCQKCHSAERTEADLDLTAFATLADVRKDARAWQRVREMIDGGQMPPRGAKQPSAAERERLQGWVHRYLKVEARASAGDPGPVVLRRLSNSEYTYTVRDLTNLGSLEPTREFPVDGAAGEGFMNTGSSLVMSPSLLTKYLDAGKEIASHAVLLPDGFRFSTRTTRRDWTDEAVGAIKAFYAQFADVEGKIPLERYLAATLEERGAFMSREKTVAGVASERGLNPKYLATLWTLFNAKGPSLLLEPLRGRWRLARPGDAGALAAEIGRWQQALWSFKSVGHMKAWQVPVSPVATTADVRLKIPPQAEGKSEVRLYLTAGDAGDGNEHDYAVWREPRIVAPGRPSLSLRDVRDVSRELAEKRGRVFAAAAQCLAAADEANAGDGKFDVSELAKRHGVEPDVLDSWLNYLGIGTGGAVQVVGHFTEKSERVSGHDFVKAWRNAELPSIYANSSDLHVRIPGNMKPHGVTMHPSPDLQVAVGWQSPVAATLKIDARVTHAHPECGNGVTWALEIRRGATRQRLAAGVSAGSREVKVGPVEKLDVHAGDLVSLLVGPRNGNHACDLTDVELVIASLGEPRREWSLTRDVSGDVLAGNPHADLFGNEGVWHFYTEPVSGGSETGPVIPPESLLARWRAASTGAEKKRLAEQVQTLLISAPPAAKDSPDAALHRQLSSLGGPLFRGLIASLRSGNAQAKGYSQPANSPANAGWGLDPALFGRHPDGRSIDAASLCVRAPSIVEIRLPADLVAGCEFVATGVIDQGTGAGGSVQLQALTAKPVADLPLSPGLPILVHEGTGARERVEAALDEFRQVFPAAVCYSRVVPVDEVITITLFHREDEHLARLMLDDAQKSRIDRLWDELHYVSNDPLNVVEGFAQLMEFATQDSDPRLFEPLRQPINERAAAFRKQLVATEPVHLDALLDFAALAYRHPLSGGEEDELRGLYRNLRSQGLSHEEAFRLTLARVLISPAFLYRLETPGPGTSPSHVPDGELASRLSYFLWSSIPDAELREAASAGRLHVTEPLVAQTRRMMSDGRVRRLATEFACQWLNIRDFDELDEKSERHFPTFGALRGAMYEESIRFFTDLFQRDGSLLDIFDADYTFVNDELAKHYGMPKVVGKEWRRVEGVKRFGRGGILGMATTLAKQSGASRTSPILRGNWLSETLLGEKLPRPPKDIPTLPDDEAATDGLTVRQLVEKHRSIASCAVCHDRIDPFGFALEGFDAIGRLRDKDLGNRPIDARATLKDGREFEGLDGLRGYLLSERKEQVVRQFCRKLLGYGLGRSVQLSDEPLLDEMLARLQSHDYRVSVAVEMIVTSPQFRRIRGRDVAEAE